MKNTVKVKRATFSCLMWTKTYVPTPLGIVVQRVNGCTDSIKRRWQHTKWIALQFQKRESKEIKKKKRERESQRARVTERKRERESQRENERVKERMREWESKERERREGVIESLNGCSLSTISLLKNDNFKKS